MGKYKLLRRDIFHEHLSLAYPYVVRATPFPAAGKGVKPWPER